MKDKEYTHIGTLKSAISLTDPNKAPKRLLRETKKYWITSGGNKYHKDTGLGVGDWPMYRLDLASIYKRPTV